MIYIKSSKIYVPKMFIVSLFTIVRNGKVKTVIAQSCLILYGPMDGAQQAFLYVGQGIPINVPPETALIIHRISRLPTLPSHLAAAAVFAAQRSREGFRNS